MLSLLTRLGSATLLSWIPQPSLSRAFDALTDKRLHYRCYIFRRWDMISAGRKSVDRPEPIFLGNQLALDFVNTRPLIAGQLTELLPDFAALLSWFREADLLNAREAAALRQKWGGSMRARRTTEAVRQWRERLRKQILAWERGDSLQRSILEELNSLMAVHPMRTRIQTKGMR